MAGLPKPQSTVDTIKSRRRIIDDAEAEATGAVEEQESNVGTEYDKPKAKPKPEAKGLPKPSTFERIKKFFTGDK